MHRRPLIHRSSLSIAVLALLLVGMGGACISPGAGTADPLASTSLMATVEALCTREAAGRLSGSAGYQHAVDQVTARFAALGLEPAGDTGYCQSVELELNEIVSTPRLAIAGRSEQLVVGRDFVARGFSGSGQVKAPVVFVGYGMSAPELGYDDYADVDVGGAVVLAFKEAPPWTPEGGDWGEAHLPRPKARAAREHGAVAMLLVSDPEQAHISEPFASVLHGPGEQDTHFPVLHLSIPVANELVGGESSSLAARKTELDESRRPHSQALPASVELEVEARYVPRHVACNVLGILRGADDSSGHVLIGAHLDHVGAQGELVLAGANDNASGVAGVLAVAEAMAARREKPSRSVVFALFAGEEQGLLGAKAYVERPSLPLADCVAMLNLDCIGQGRAIKLGSGEAYPELWQLAKRIDGEHDQMMVDESWWGGGADAQPFFDAGVPTLYFNLSDGYHHIHRAVDNPDTLDREVFAATARLAYLTTAAVADGEYDGEQRHAKSE